MDPIQRSRRHRESPPSKAIPDQGVRLVMSTLSRPLCAVLDRSGLVAREHACALDESGTSSFDVGSRGRTPAGRPAPAVAGAALIEFGRFRPWIALWSSEPALA